MALTERLQLIIESSGSGQVIGDFRKIGQAGESEFGRVAKTAEQAARDVKTAQDRMAAAAVDGAAKVTAASQKLEAAQLKAAQSSQALERAQASLANTAPGTIAAANAAEKLEQAQLKAAHAAQAVATAESKVAVETQRAATAQDHAAQAITEAQKAQERLATTTAQSGSVASGALDKLGVSSGKLGLSIKELAIGAGLGGAAIAKMAVNAVNAASDLAESASKARQVFGPQAVRDIERFGDAAARSLGLSKQEALEAASSFGNLFRGMQLGQQESAKLSKEIVGLGADLASFNNLNIQDVLGDLRSGLVGEAEPLRKYGVLLNEAAVSAKAAQLGLGALGGELTEQEKVQARYAIILEQTKIAQGDFARTSDGLANQQRILSAEFRNFSAAIGQELLPIVTKGVSILNTFLDIATRLHLPVGELIALAAGATLASKAVQALTNRFVAQAVAASGAAASSAAAARANTALAASSTAVAGANTALAGSSIAAGAAVAGAAGASATAARAATASTAATRGATAATVGLGDAAKTVVPTLVGLYAAFKLGEKAGDSVSDTFREKFLPGIIELERRIPVLGKWLAKQDEEHYKVGRSATKAASEIETLAKAQLVEKEKTEAVAKELEKLEARKESNTAASKNLAEATRSGVVALEGLRAGAGDTATNLDRMVDAAGRLTTELDKLFDSAVSLDEATASYEQSLDDLQETFANSADVAKAQERLADAQEKLNDLRRKQSADTKLTISDEIALKNAEEAVTKATNDLADAHKGAGKSLDLASEAGRQNVKAINDVVVGIKSHIKALIETGTTQDNLRSTFNAHIDDFKRVLRQIGFNEEEIGKLAEKYGLIPETVETAVKLLGTQEAIKLAESTAMSIAEKFKIAQEAAKITVQLFGVDQAESSLAGLRQDAGNIIPQPLGPPAPAQVGPPAPTGPVPDVIIGPSGEFIPTNQPSAPPPPEPSGPLYTNDYESDPNFRASGGLVPTFAAGGVPRFASAGYLPTGMVGDGFKTSRARAIVGEGNPAFPEYVVPTDPQYRRRALKLFDSLASDLRVDERTPRHAEGMGPYRPSRWFGMETNTSSLAREIASALAATLGDRQTNFGPFYVSSKSDDRLPTSLAREIRRELYLSGR